MKIHPDLVEHGDLKPKKQKIDINAEAVIPELLASKGFEIYRLIRKAVHL